MDVSAQPHPNGAVALAESIVDRFGAPYRPEALRGPAPGGTGTTIILGHLADEDIDYAAAWQLPARWDTLERMETDSKVAGLANAELLPILAAEWDVLPAGTNARDQANADRCRAQLLDRRGDLSWHSIIRMAHRYRGRGCQFLAPEYALIDGEYVLARLSERHPKTITEWLPGDRGYDDFGGFKQEIWQNGAYHADVSVPAERLLALWNDRKGSNWYGTPGWRPLYRSHYLRDKLWRALGIHASRFAAGIPTLERTTPGGAAHGTDDEEEKTLRNIAVHEKAYVRVPYGAKLGLFGGGSTMANVAPVLDAIRDLRQEMAEAAGGQLFQLGQSGAGGAYALAETYSRYVVLGLQAVAGYLCGVLQELCDQITILNDPGADAPVLSVASVRIEDSSELVAAALEAKDKGALTWTPRDEVWTRQRLGLPEVAVEELEAEEPEPEPQPEPTPAESPAPAELHDHPAPWILAEPKSFRPWRPMTDGEKLVDWQELDETPRGTADALAAEIGMIRKDIADAIAPRIRAELRRRDLDIDRMRAIEGVVRSKRKAIVAKVREALDDTYKLGQRTAREELTKAGIKLAEAPHTAAEFAQTLTAQAELVTDKILAPFISELLDAIEAAKTAGNEDVGAVLARTGALSDGPIKRAAAGRIWGALNMGRRLVATRAGVSTATYSALLDDATCPPCRDADGTEAKVDSRQYDAMTPPLRSSGFSDGCEGRDWCRCLWIYTEA